MIEVLFSNNPIPMWIYDLETTKINKSNRAAHEKYGYTKEEFNELTLYDLRPEDENERLKKDLSTSDEAYQLSGLWKHIKKNGEIVYVEIISHSVNERERLVAAIDFTSKKKAEDALKENQRQLEEKQKKLKFLIEAGDILYSSLNYKKTLKRISKIIVPELADWCAVDILDKSGNLERVSIVHKDPKKLNIVKKLQDEYPPNNDGSSGINKVLITGKYDLHPAIDDDLLKKSTEDEEHYNILKSLGLCAALIMPLKIRDKVIGAITFAQSESNRTFLEDDLSYAQEIAKRASIAIENSMLYDELKVYSEDLEEKVKERTNQLQNTNKELESFSYSVSHDLRAPLRHIEGFLKLLEKDLNGKITEKSEKYLNIVLNAARKMNKLIDDLLDFSRLGRINISAKLTSMDKIVEESLSELKKDIMSKKAKIKKVKMHQAKLDEDLMKLVWTNLISNSLKYASKERQAEIEMGSFEKDDKIIYYIKDNGVGFDNEYAERIFGIFQRLHTDQEYKGTGIGLANIKRIINKHGGEVWGEGKLNEGAAFYFTIGNNYESN